MSLHMSTNVWKSTELPLLRPNVASSSLEEVTLIISVYDFDAIGRDDPLGCVSVPLTPTSVLIPFAPSSPLLTILLFPPFSPSAPLLTIRSLPSHHPIPFSSSSSPS